MACAVRRARISDNNYGGRKKTKEEEIDKRVLIAEFICRKDELVDGGCCGLLDLEEVVVVLVVGGAG